MQSANNQDLCTIENNNKNHSVMETILFFIKRKKLLKDGTASIFVRVTSGKLSAEVATGKSVLPSQWVATKGRAKGNTLKTK